MMTICHATLLGGLANKYQYLRYDMLLYSCILCTYYYFLITVLTCTCAYSPKSWFILWKLIKTLIVVRESGTRFFLSWKNFYLQKKFWTQIFEQQMTPKIRQYTAYDITAIVHIENYDINDFSKKNKTEKNFSLGPRG